MTDVILERTFDPALEPGDVLQMAVEGAECFSMRRVDWCGSLLAIDGRRLVCWFQGPDAQSVGDALRQAGADTSVLWPGTVHQPTPVAPPDPGAAWVLVARRFEQPVTVESVQAVEDARAWCLEAHGVRFLHTFFSRDALRMLCLYRAPDADSVRLSQRQAQMPMESVWACRYVHPMLGTLPTP